MRFFAKQAAAYLGKLKKNFLRRRSQPVGKHNHGLNGNKKGEKIST
jgi:hypothetical protein